MNEKILSKKIYRLYVRKCVEEIKKNGFSNIIPYFQIRKLFLKKNVKICILKKYGL